jgi:hypothetical protein
VSRAFVGSDPQEQTLQEYSGVSNLIVNVFILAENQLNGGRTLSGVSTCPNYIRSHNGHGGHRDVQLEYSHVFGSLLMHNELTSI